ncbi:MAG: phosphoribosylformylglycinamidine synthase subunit PurL [Acidobacteriota bacterium]|nr:phosphoribosylformylglycinamidine synthase subunit PurL [Acidobacteriota bacterium]
MVGVSNPAPPSPTSLHRALGLSDDELDDIRKVLSREPNHLELALYAVMWSEHCSYKSSRLHLRRLPSKAAHVLVGPGEGAGVIDAGDGIGVAIRIESHNHPSAIEPYQGAATGVGGILRDVFSMGARPLAVMDPLFFGELDDARNRWLVEGVVSGISGYGNSVGVPTIGGELTFDQCYGANPLVNVLAVGALPTSRLALGVASGIGNYAVLLGSLTGRDGIGGVSVLASAGFSGEDGAASIDEAKRPSVQVGDPYEEKRLIEACLELLDHGYVVGIQDLGGAGLICATSETAAKGGVGMDVDVTAVPLRELGMQPFEVMTSESQERMLAIITPENLAAVNAVCDKWEVRATVVGHVVEPALMPDGSRVGLLRVREGFDGEVLGEVPASSLADESPLYDRPRQRPRDLDAILADDPSDDEPVGDPHVDLAGLLVDTAWVSRQYDSQLFLNTVVGPGRDAALLRLAGPGLPPSRRGFAVSTDSNPRWCALDPRNATALTVAEGVANLACVGASAQAIVNCLNFGNPEHPEVMWQLSESIDGMAMACDALSLPVIGGNVSLYNESGGRDIDPTPVVGSLGVVASLVAPPPGWNWRAGDAVVLVGHREAAGGRAFPLGGSRWATRRGRRGGRLAEFDASRLRATFDFVTGEVAAVCAGEPSDLTAVHDVSGGGLAVALAEMAAATTLGVSVDELEGHGELFAEFPGRFVMATSDAGALVARAQAAGVPVSVLGVVGGTRLRLGTLVDLDVREMADQRASALERALRRD